MTEAVQKSVFEAMFISTLEKLPVISYYAKIRGWPFILSWVHRITGILLVLFLWFHICFIESLYALGNGRVSKFFLLALLIWILTLPSIFHILNGGRLILYEIFGKRNDESMIRWVFGLSLLYMALLGLLMLMGNQEVSPFFYWLVMFMTALILGYGVASRTWDTEHSFVWKLQRISGAFLLVMVPAYILFMHLTPSWGPKASTLSMGIQHFSIKAFHLILLAGALFHGSYGLWSVVNDYISSRPLRTGLTALVTLVTLIFAWAGIKTILNS